MKPALKMMADEEGRRPTAESADDGDLGVAYTISLQMENLHDKLKLLDYENEFVDQMKMKPIHRYGTHLPISCME